MTKPVSGERLSAAEFYQEWSGKLVNAGKRGSEEMFAFAEAFASAQSRWIPVGERLPESKQDVLIFVADDWEGGKNFVTTETYDPDLNEEAWHDGRVTHWQPLPSPPDPKGE